MSRRMRQLAGFLLISVVAVLLTACSGGKAPWGDDEPTSAQDLQAQAFADLRKEIGIVVTDKDRRLQILGHVTQMEEVFAQAEVAMLEQRSKLRQLNWDYYTPRQSFDDLIVETDDIVAAHQDQMLEIRAKLAAELTDAEWDALNKVRSRAVGAAFDSLDPS